MTTIATWNVNSIKARLPHLLDWLRETQTDIVLLQETKTEDASFPAMEIEDLGYNLVFHGQKSYNGVAILSRLPIDESFHGLPGDASDEQARYIEAVISLPESALRVASIYVPNGQDVDSDKFQYKQRFFERLYEHFQTTLTHEEMTIFGGDYNVAPEAIDVYDAGKLDGPICYHPIERAAFRSLLHLGYTESFRTLHPTTQQFSWWDYRGGAYQGGKGLRIDHLLLSPQAADRLTKSWIDESPRRLQKPSDHTPVVCELTS